MFSDVFISNSMSRNSRKTAITHDNDLKCIFGDLDSKDVEIHSQKYTVRYMVKAKTIILAF